MMFFEEARQKAEADYKIAPRDAQVRLARAGPGLGMEVNGETGCSESTAPPTPWMFFFFFLTVSFTVVWEAHLGLFFVGGGSSSPRHITSHTHTQHDSLSLSLSLSLIALHPLPVSPSPVPPNRFRVAGVDPMGWRASRVGPLQARPGGCGDDRTRRD